MGKMKKQDVLDLVEVWYEKSKALLAMQHDYRLQEIRLESANKRKIEEFKSMNMQEHYRRKNEHKRFERRNEECNP